MVVITEKIVDVFHSIKDFEENRFGDIVQTSLLSQVTKFSRLHPHMILEIAEKISFRNCTSC